MPGPAPLFTREELADWLDIDAATVSTGNHARIEQVVWGWLKPRLGFEQRPDPVPAEVYSWALELGGIARENPAGRSADTLGSDQQQFSEERRIAILAEATRWAPAGASPKGGPVATFPPAPSYPDPARW